MLSRLFQVAFWCALIIAFVMASLPQPPPLSGSIDDKILHALAFFLLAALAALAFPRMRLEILFVGLAFFGGLIELVQAIPSLGRTPSLLDWLADLIGAGFVLGGIALVRWSRT